MSKRYSNKGFAQRQAAAQQPKKDNSALIMALISVGISLLVVLGAGIAIFASGGGFAVKVDMEEVKSEIDSFEVSDFAETDDVTNYVKITVEKHGDIVLRLRPDIAPETVKNFQDLVKSGHYDGKTFHRVVQNFMIQGGGFDESGIEASTPKIMGEFTANGFHNNLKHVRGVISMARLNGANNSATCQFFICDATSAHLDDNYASFGYVLAGMDTVDSIAAVKTLEEKPILTVKIEKVVFVDPLK